MGAERSQWQFPANEVGKVIGWSDEASPSNPNASKGLVNKGPFLATADVSDDPDLSVDGDKVPTRESVKAYVDAKATTETKTSLAAKTVPASVDAILLVGDAAEGDDNDGDPVLLARSPSATVGYLPDAAATKFAYLSRTIKFSKAFHGADPTGAADNSAALYVAFDEIKAKGGGELIIPNGEYLFSGSQSQYTMDENFVMTWKPDALFVADTDRTTQAVNLRGATGDTVAPYVWTFNNPRIDMTDGAFTSNQPSGIAMQNVREVYGHDGYFQGGADYETSPTVGGDSALEPINITNFKWDGGYFEGWIDAGLYAGGGNTLTTADDGTRYEMVNGFFRRCGQGITFKRSGNLLVAHNNYFDFCSIGITSADVGAGQEVDTGQRMLITDNVIKKTTGRAIGVRGQTVADIHDNWIEDWGYDTTGTTLGAAAPSTGRQAILMQGGLYSRISGNRFRMKDWTANDHVGILVTNYTDADSTVWEGGRISGADNEFFDVALPVYEVVANSQPSYLTASRISSGVVTFPAFNTGSVFEESTNGNAHRIYYLGVANAGIRTIEPRETFSYSAQGTFLSSAGSLAAGATASGSFAVPGALNTDIVVLTPNSSAGLNSNIVIAARANTGLVEWSVKNTSAGAIDFAAINYSVLVIRRDQ